MPASNDRAAAAQTTAASPEQDLTQSLTDDAVCEYLKEHHDFLQRHPEMLDYLHISHPSGSAVSLVEKQVSVLRERNMDMRHRLSALTAHARDNDRLFERTRALVLQLMAAQSGDALHQLYIEAMTRDFGVEHASMILYGETARTEGCRIETRETARTEIGALFKGHKAVCGTLRKEELGFLFPLVSEVGSAAIMPLGGDDQLGLIAVGSSDANRYNSTVGTLFLSHIADVITCLLPHLPQESN